MATSEKCAAAAASRAVYKIHFHLAPQVITFELLIYIYSIPAACCHSGGYSTNFQQVAKQPIGHWPLAKVRSVHQLNSRHRIENAASADA